MIKVLMLGWELPPKITGGLGVACDGILSGLGSINSVSATFILPQLKGGEKAYGAQLLTANTNADCNVIESSYHCNADQLSKARQFAHDALEATKSLRFDLIHAHDWLCVPAALAIVERTKVPVVLHMHSTEYDRSGPGAADSIIKIEQEGLQYAEKVIAVSKVTARHISKRYNIEHSKISVVYNALHQTAISRDYALASSSKPLISFIGRLTYQKGPLYFIKAAKKILDNGFDVTFVMAGDGDMLESCIDLVKTLQMEKQFSFPGFLSNAQVYDLLEKSRIFIMPSLFEPFGIVALEAMAAGVPTIVSKTSGIAEITNHCEKIDAWNTDEIADAARRILCDGNYALSLARRAKQDIKSMNWSAAAKNIYEIYETIIHSRRENIGCDEKEYCSS